MPEINLDYSQFNDEKREFSVLPEGNYNVKVLGSCFDDTDHLNEKLLQVSVGIEEGRGSYKSRNIIKRAWKYGDPLDVKKKVKPPEKKQPDYNYEDDDVPF